VRRPRRSVFPPKKDASISVIYKCRRVGGEIAGPSRQTPPFPAPLFRLFYQVEIRVLNSFG
jgi:hypothetical protein